MLFYNLDNNRDPQQVVKEVKALLRMDKPVDDRPVLLGMCEATGYDLPDLKGFHKVRDRSTKSRANIAAYVRNDVWAGGLKWVDLSHTWSRTNPGASGQHEPRSYPVFKLGQMQALVHHQAPKQCDNAQAAQQEGIDSLVATMKPAADANQHQTDRARICVADMNKRKGDPAPGPDQLAKQIGGTNSAPKIDTVVWRGQGKVTDVAYPSKVNGVKLKSDHGHALRFKFTADATWWEV